MSLLPFLRPIRLTGELLLHLSEIITTKVSRVSVEFCHLATERNGKLTQVTLHPAACIPPLEVMSPFRGHR